jgi:hypothetical protein
MREWLWMMMAGSDGVVEKKMKRKREDEAERG